MNATTSNCPSDFYRWPKQFCTYSYRAYRQQEHHQDNHGRYYKHSGWFAASGLGITLVGESFESEHLQNFCETNFDTIRQSRPAVPRSILPSFASCTPFDENSSFVTTSKDLDDAIHGPKLIPSKLLYPRPRVNHQSFDSAGPPFHASPMVSQSSADPPHENLGRTRPNHPLRSISHYVLVNHRNPPLPSHPPATSHRQRRCVSPSASPPTRSYSPTIEASDPVHSADPPNSHQSGSTRLPNRLRNCHSLQFIKPKQIQSPYPSHYNLINSQSRPITPLITSNISNQQPFVSSPYSQSQQYSVDSCSPEQLPFCEVVPVTLQPTKFTNFVRSTLQKTTLRSNSHSQSSHLLDLKSERDHLQFSSSEPFSHYNSSSRSLTLGPTSEISKHSLRHTFTPPLSMSRTHETEIESLNDQRASPGKMTPPLRASFSQPFLAGHYNKTSLTGSRSHSALDAHTPHTILRRSGSSLSVLANVPSVIPLGSGPQPHYIPGKSSNSGATSVGSPPRKSMRTQFSRLAQLLAPSPAPKPSHVTTRVKATSLTSKPKSLFSTGSSSSKHSELRSKTALCKVPESLPSSSQCTSTATPMAIINWRHSISDHEYQIILENWGPTEIHRQQLIWELSQTETAFLDSVTLISDFFINPLKKSECGSWVAGVPPAVQKMFSDLDQIADLHSEIVMTMTYHRMCEKKRNNAPVILRFADMMATFVPRLRIYESYLVCFEHVCQIIDQLCANQADNFGVFVKIQSEAAGLGSMPLTSYLLKPIQRLMKYPLFFRQLGETTPVGHPDHLPTSHLWKATDGIIRLMQDVKGSEDEHSALRRLEEQLLGLPDGLVLANRRRRIVARGTFQRVYPSSKDAIKLSEPSRNKLGTQLFAQFKPISNSRPPSSRPPSSLALLGDSVTNPSAHRMARCLSPVSDSSENSEGTHSQSSYHSINTDSTSDFTNSHEAPIPKLSRTSWSTSCGSIESSPCPDGLLQDFTPITIKPHRPLSNKRSSHNIIKRGPTTELVEVILLSDLIVLCTRDTPSKKNFLSSKKFDDACRFRLLDSIGISRLMDVEDISGQLDNFEDLVRLEVFPELSSASRKNNSQVSPGNENDPHSGNVIYLSGVNSPPLIGSGESKKLSRGAMGSLAGLLPISTPNFGGISTTQDWKSWVKEFKKLELQTHHFYRRNLRQSEQKRRRSTTGKIDMKIKRCSSMNNLGAF